MGDRLADVAADVRLAHPAVKNVDSGLFATVDDRLAFLCVVPFQPFAAQTDFTDHQTSFSKTPVLHVRSLILFY